MKLFIAKDSVFNDDITVCQDYNNLVNYLNDHCFGTFCYDIYSIELEDNEALNLSNIENIGTFIDSITTS